MGLQFLVARAIFPEDNDDHAYGGYMLGLARVEPTLYHNQPCDPHHDMVLRYLGTAGFEVKAAGHTLVIDPFITRPNLRQTMFSRLVPDAQLIQRVLPHADDVIIGHAHHDHVLDAPTLCKHTGARLIGSPDTANVGRAAGLPESQIVETCGREDIATGPGIVRGLPSRHGRVYFNRVSLPGNIPEPPPWPPRVTDLRHGLVLNWYVELGGVRMVHVDSADFIEEELEGLQADVVCLCAIGRAYRPNYVKTAIEMLRPKYIIPCHWDYFFTPYFEEPWCLPKVDLPGMVQEIKKGGVEPVILPFDGKFSL